jgi:hypothetical protein
MIRNPAFIPALVQVDSFELVTNGWFLNDTNTKSTLLIDFMPSCVQVDR